MSDYVFRTLEFDEWLHSVAVGDLALRDVFAAGAASGADGERGVIYQSLPDWQQEAEDEGAGFVDFVRRALDRWAEEAER